jgi:hypothetical protein
MAPRGGGTPPRQQHRLGGLVQVQPGDPIGLTPAPFDFALPWASPRPPARPSPLGALLKTSFRL